MSRLTTNAVLTLVVGLDCGCTSCFSNRFFAIEAMSQHPTLEHRLSSSDPILSQDHCVLSFQITISSVTRHNNNK